MGLILALIAAALIFSGGGGSKPPVVAPPKEPPKQPPPTKTPEKPPAAKGLPPRQSDLPPPTPAAQVSVPKAAKKVDPPADEWKLYGWYTYKGKSDQVMWIRVDQKWDAVHLGLFDSVNYGPSLRDSPMPRVDEVYRTRGTFEHFNEQTAIRLPRVFRFVSCIRWTIIIGTETMFARSIMDLVEVGCDDAFTEKGCTEVSRPAMWNEWIYPTAGQLAARAAADWIDVAYGGGN